ncbi:MAG: STAS domain-containing protein [Pseudomonadota bacterium]
MINEQKIGDVHVLSVTKERMNAAVSLALKESLVALLPQSKFVVDLSAVALIDSGGLGGLVSILKATNASDAQLVIFGLQKPVRVMFELTRMHKLFEIYNDLDECLSILQ